MARRVVPAIAFLAVTLCWLWACAFDDTLREYLSASFWLPFAKRAVSFERPHVRRISEPYAGMQKGGEGALAKLRDAYRKISEPQQNSFGVEELRETVAAARADQSLNSREKEEVDLIDAKIDMRAGEPDEPEMLDSAKRKLLAFLKTARTRAFQSEARGWLAYVYHLEGNQTAAGKIYLDELNRNGSNLSRETLLTSLQMNYGYDGGQQLVDHLPEYFDTPEHAAFAIQLVTNPHWTRYGDAQSPDRLLESHRHLLRLLEEHRELLDRNAGANSFALLAMRTALRMGDPETARRLGESVPMDAAVRAEPDFLWMLASTRFLARDYAAAEEPLLALFRSPRADKDRRAAAAYGLCGVYWKTENRMEQLRYALWLHTQVHAGGFGLSYPSEITDFTLYWTFSGWDLGLLLETEAPIEVLQAFIDQNPSVPDLRLVKYSLAVRLTREERYEEAAKVYEAIHAVRRAPRLRQLAALYEEANRTGLAGDQRLEARYKLAEFIESHENGIYFNDALWDGFQSYVFQGAKDSRLTRAERETLIAQERKLKDDQEEYWRAYLILHDIAQQAGKTELGRKAAALGVHCLMKISVRFGREKEIRTDARELAKLVR